MCHANGCYPEWLQSSQPFGQTSFAVLDFLATSNRVDTSQIPSTRHCVHQLTPQCGSRDKIVPCPTNARRVGSNIHRRSVSELQNWRTRLAVLMITIGSAFSEGLLGQCEIGSIASIHDPTAKHPHSYGRPDGRAVPSFLWSFTGQGPNLVALGRGRRAVPLRL